MTPLSIRIPDDVFQGLDQIPGEELVKKLRVDAKTPEPPKVPKERKSLVPPSMKVFARTMLRTLFIFMGVYFGVARPVARAVAQQFVDQATERR